MKTVIAYCWLWPSCCSWAHPLADAARAFIDHAEPKVGSIIHVAPDVVKVWFHAKKLVAAFSELQVFDAAGKQVDKHDKKLDKSGRGAAHFSFLIPPS